MSDSTTAVAVDPSASEKVGAGETAPADASTRTGAASVGNQLRDAREAAGLTLAEVAQSLKFSARQVQLLEADDYAALPGNTIVRGFVRSYARMLKLDADKLLQALAAVIPAPPVEVRPPENMGVAAQPGAVRTMAPVVTVAGVLLVAGMLLALWHFVGPAAIGPGSAVMRSEPPQQQPAVPADVPVGQQPPVPSAAVPAVVPAGESANVPASGVASEAAPPALHFAFSDRSWLEVTDANRQVLHSGESPAGSQLTLTGRPPFEMVIGNASKVTLTHGGRVVDLAPHTRAEVARLTLE